MEAWGTGLITPKARGTKSFSGNTNPRVEPGRIRHPWLGPCGLRAGRPSPIVAGNNCGENEGRNNQDVPREVLVEPVGVGTPGRMWIELGAESISKKS